MSNRRLINILLMGSIILLLSLILTDWLPILRGPVPNSSVWYWAYKPRPLARWWAAILPAAAIWLIFWGHQKWGAQKRWAAVTAVSALVLCSFLLQLGLVYANRADATAELVDRTLSVPTNGYLWTAAHIGDLNTVLRHYPEQMAAFESDHARTHPPGLIILNWLTIRGFEHLPWLSRHLAQWTRPLRCTDLWLFEQSDSVAAALAFWAFLPAVVAALTAVPAYLFVCQIANRERAMLATVVTSTLPALLIFTPLPDQIYPCLGLIIIFLGHYGLSKQQKRWFFLSGVTLSLNSFLTLGNAALLLVVVVYVGLYLWQQPAARRRKASWPCWLATFALGAASIWLVYWAVWQVPPWDIAQAGLRQHYLLVTNQREYGVWLLYNLVDLLLFAGPPVFLGFVYGLTAVRRPPRGQMTPASILTLSVAALILLLTLSGSTRGEVGRIWLFFMPLLAISATATAKQLFPTVRFVGWQLLFTLSIGVSWGAVGATIVVAERPAMPPAPAAMTPLDVQFGGAITLDSYQARVQGETLSLTLRWVSKGPADRPYTVFNHFLSNDGTLITQQDNWPVQGQWPPTCWQVGDVIIDQYEMTLPDGLSAGSYSLETGLYDAHDGSRLPTAGGKESVLFTVVVPNR